MIERENTIARQIMDFFGDHTPDYGHEIFTNDLGRFETFTLYKGDEFLVREYRSCYYENYVMEFITGKSEYIELSFFLGGADVIRDKVNGISGEFKLLHHYIYFTPGNADVEIYYEKGIFYKNLDIYVSKDYFHKLAETNPFLQEFIDKVDREQQGNLFPGGIPITPQMMGILLEIKKCEQEGIYREYFIKSRILSLLLLIFEFAKDQRHGVEAGSKISIARYDVQKLMQVREFIEHNLKSFYTIEQLSLKFGINAFKLKNGFKEMFGEGVFHYASKLRMKEALHLLKNSEYSIKEIAYQLGYASPSSFTVAFKNEVGVGPSYYRKNPKFSEVTKD
ncbi:AraC family transcriptional regulator [Elizabethkingia meningoseptica]|uniref:helix-turn-helix domain-containing protein n=1 Tax=Elizabethkingia meningoseptica TaxID=238 RepID=UPI0009990D16|nr:AraC family transcriptional regulator [Elizabethkingia meningoseptica]EJK5327400.1 helix-turn-helix transcriptional regulator [Elizabethkingia meningoseptica]MDE5429800.1 AraC family transcriptional regulator [Elizabethkingia meningoseptica]MDE5436736.1 AraC family transcriptional regulator [Elizabethkingia meningoseptica]MDE5467035.1 AraC family transcriptional regulator [Elizabethkingia meningoseptica]MDE5473735.1 AraC family transcriptional regulator [Elizabethkingia meningoseptica]